MKRIKLGLNGFGRIGRALTRIALLRDSFDFVAINTRNPRPDILPRRKYRFARLIPDNKRAVMLIKPGMNASIERIGSAG